MRRDPFTEWLPLRDELIVDSFAGAGGASIGIEHALAPRWAGMNSPGRAG